MCVYSGENEDVCGQIFTKGLSDDDKAEVVNVHNQLRQNVAGGNVDGLPAAKAGSMKTMVTTRIITFVQKFVVVLAFSKLENLYQLP